jgi:hypothetical protein
MNHRPDTRLTDITGDRSCRLDSNAAPHAALDDGSRAAAALSACGLRETERSSSRARFAARLVRGRCLVDTGGHDRICLN